MEVDAVERHQLMYRQPMPPKIVVLYCSIPCPYKELQLPQEVHRDLCREWKALHKPTLEKKCYIVLIMLKKRNRLWALILNAF